MRVIFISIYIYIVVVVDILPTDFIVFIVVYMRSSLRTHASRVRYIECIYLTFFIYLKIKNLLKCWYNTTNNCNIVAVPLN